MSSGPADDTARQGHEILVADSDQARGQCLAQACIEAGMSATTAPHGSAALEQSLTASPDLIVAELDLPLICGKKLADILRANPRTRGVRFLFLGPEGGGTRETTEVGDARVAVSAPRAEVLRVIVEQLARGDRLDALQAASLTENTVRGDLAKLPLADLLQVAHLARKTGRIELEREGDGESLALAADEPNNCLERGSVLLRDGEVLQAAIENVVGQKALFRMLAWREGRFVFDTEHQPDTTTEPLAPVRALLAEGMRQIGEWDRLALQLPSLSATVKLSVQSRELPNIVHPLTQEVLLLLEHFDRVREIVDRCSFPDYQVLRTLHTLDQRNIVSVGQLAVRGLAPSAARDGLFDEGQLRRLRDRLQGATPRGERIGSGKILLVAREVGSLVDWVKLMRTVPALELSPELERGDNPRLELGPLARIRLDDDLELELLQVPSASSYRPLWPLAAHDALATLFLHGQGVSELDPHENELMQRLQDATNMNVVHVALLGRKQRLCPEDLQENFSLLDEASVFLIPLESSKEPTSLVRNLFARILP